MLGRRYFANGPTQRRERSSLARRWILASLCSPKNCVNDVAIPQHPNPSAQPNPLTCDRTAGIGWRCPNQAIGWRLTADRRPPNLLADNAQSQWPTDWRRSIKPMGKSRVTLAAAVNGCPRPSGRPARSRFCCRKSLATMSLRVLSTTATILDTHTKQ